MAGGLLFIGVTDHDPKFQAYEKSTGELLRETTLPADGNATPATYEANGANSYSSPAAANQDARQAEATWRSRYLEGGKPA